jgi:hypothetical protein
MRVNSQNKAIKEVSRSPPSTSATASNGLRIGLWLALQLKRLHKPDARSDNGLRLLLFLIILAPDYSIDLVRLESNRVDSLSKHRSVESKHSGFLDQWKIWSSIGSKTSKSCGQALFGNYKKQTTENTKHKIQ